MGREETLAISLLLYTWEGCSSARGHHSITPSAVDYTPVSNAGVFPKTRAAPDVGVAQRTALAMTRCTSGW